MVVEKLINEGANINAKTHSRSIPLHAATQKGHYKILKVLISFGADVNAKNLNKETSLHKASKYASYPHLYKANDLYNQRYISSILVEILLREGAEVNAESRLNTSKTSFIIAAQKALPKYGYSHRDLLLLLSFGADIDLSNWHARTVCTSRLKEIFSDGHSLEKLQAWFNLFITFEKALTQPDYQTESQKVFQSLLNDFSSIVFECKFDSFSLKKELAKKEKYDFYITRLPITIENLSAVIQDLNRVKLCFENSLISPKYAELIKFMQQSTPEIEKSITTLAQYKLDLLERHLESDENSKFKSKINHLIETYEMKLFLERCGLKIEELKEIINNQDKLKYLIRTQTSDYIPPKNVLLSKELFRDLIEYFPDRETLINEVPISREEILEDLNKTTCSGLIS